MKWVTMTTKAGKEIVRDKTALFFILMFPIIFILIFGAAFGSFTGGNTTYNIAVINLDEGIEINNNTINHGEQVIDILKNMKYQDNKGKNTSTEVFDVRTDLTESKAQELVEDQDLTAYIIIPRNFSAAVLAESMRYVQSAVSTSIQDQFIDMTGNINYSDPAAIQAVLQQFMLNMTGSSSDYDKLLQAIEDDVIATVLIQGDPGSAMYYTVSGIIESVLRGYIEEVGIITLSHSAEFLPFEIEPSSQDPHVIIENKAMKASELSAFDYQVPGIIVFALLMGAMMVTIYMAKEESRGTLKRLKITKMSSFDLLFGTTIPFTILAAVQILILVGVALIMGYHYNPEANILLAIFIAVIGALASVALGLILAAVVKNEDQAGSIAPAITVPLSFLTGAFFPMPSVVLSHNFLGTGKSFELFDWLPWTQCSKGLSKVLTFGASFGEVALEIGLMILFTTILFIIGVLLYHKKRLRAI